ncbi:MAG: right-handed parallel beta-helix repeat-containing protein [Planctomycetes bacterium]|nr:right-handed parallel beta-helix repeat-containing protein [Planctomycetota bacterium]
MPAKPQTTPAPDGSSWSLALPFLEDAIQAAISDTNTTDIDFIVVAQGVYHPGDTTTSPNNTDQSKSFVLQPRMRIGGGFRGIAGLPSNANDRDPSTYVTILSGDLDDDDVDSHVDGLHQAARNENSFLVVQVSDFSTPVDDVAELDGLVIRDGQSSYSWLGAGIFVPTDCNPNIRNCVIKKNRIINNGLGSDGAGIYVEMNASLFNLTILIEDTVIEDNESGAGGGIALSNYSKARLTGCTVRHNKATGVGGGGLMAHDFALFTLLDCDVSENTAISEYGPAGGGVRIVKDAELYMKNSTVRLNEAIDTGAFVCGGGGIYVAGRSRADIVSTTIEGNSASGLGVVDGGGVYVDTDEENMPASRLINTMIHDNDATTSHEETFSQGGGIFVGQPENCTRRTA